MYTVKKPLFFTQICDKIYGEKLSKFFGIFAAFYGRKTIERSRFLCFHLPMSGQRS